MVTIDTFRAIALSLPEASEEPHFEKTSFRVRKKIFATYDEVKNIACIKLSEADQDVFSSADGALIYPVANKWGKQGWTLVEMQQVNEELFAAALLTAYCEVAPKKLAGQIRANESLQTNRDFQDTYLDYHNAESTVPQAHK